MSRIHFYRASLICWRFERVSVSHEIIYLGFTSSLLQLFPVNYFHQETVTDFIHSINFSSLSGAKKILIEISSRSDCDNDRDKIVARIH